MRDWASELRAIADGRLMLHVRNGVTVSRSMLAMIADEIDALRAAPLAPAEVGRLVGELRDTYTEWNNPPSDGLPNGAGIMLQAATALEAQAAELAEVHQRYVDANEARIDAEAQLAEARKALGPFARFAAVGGQQDDEPRAYIVHAPEDDYYGTGPDNLQFHPLAQRDLDNGYRQTPLYGRPALELSENTGELIDKMAEAIRGDTTSDDTPWATLSEDRKIGWRGDAERALAVVKEYLTARRPAEQAVTKEMVEALRNIDAEAPAKEPRDDWTSTDLDEAFYEGKLRGFWEMAVYAREALTAALGAQTPPEGAVTEAMVGAAEEVFFKTDDHGEPSYDMRAALKAAMEAGRDV